MTSQFDSLFHGTGHHKCSADHADGYKAFRNQTNMTSAWPFSVGAPCISSLDDSGKYSLFDVSSALVVGVVGKATDQELKLHLLDPSERASGGKKVWREIIVLFCLQFDL